MHGFHKLLEAASVVFNAVVCLLDSLISIGAYVFCTHSPIRSRLYLFETAAKFLKAQHDFFAVKPLFCFVK